MGSAVVVGEVDVIFSVFVVSSFQVFVVSFFSMFVVVIFCVSFYDFREVDVIISVSACIFFVLAKMIHFLMCGVGWIVSLTTHDGSIVVSDVVRIALRCPDDSSAVV